MSSIQTSEWNARRVVAELPFIPAASNWFKLLLSLLAEPLMFLSSLYIIAVTVLPGSAGWPGYLNIGAKTIMSIAPEIILPGCFQQAQAANRVGNKRKAHLLYALAGLFILLTVVTLASFVWNFSTEISGLVLFIRCGSGIAYTIILQISANSGVNESVVPVVDVYEMLDTLAHSQTSLGERIRENESAVTGKMGNFEVSLSRKIEALERQIEASKNFHSSRIEGTKEAFSSQIETTKSDLQTAFTSQLETLLYSLSGDIQFQIGNAKNESLEALQASINSQLANILKEIDTRVSSQKKTDVTQPEASKRVNKISPPGKQIETRSFDRRTFVFECLTDNPEMTVNQLVNRAKEQGFKLSVGSASQYRNAFKSGDIEASSLENETDVPPENEASISENESEMESQLEAQSYADETRIESFIEDESFVDTGELESVQLSENESEMEE